MAAGVRIEEVRLIEGDTLTIHTEGGHRVFVSLWFGKLRLGNESGMRKGEPVHVVQAGKDGEWSVMTE